MRILVVEDDPATGDALETLLQMEGHETDHAGDGHCALVRLQVLDFDAIVMDYMMPGLDGLAALKRIRDAGFDRLPVIMQTAVAGDDLDRLRAEVKYLGKVKLLAKPYQPAELLRLLREP